MTVLILLAVAGALGYVFVGNMFYAFISSNITDGPVWLDQTNCVIASIFWPIFVVLGVVYGILLGLFKLTVLAWNSIFRHIWKGLKWLLLGFPRKLGHGLDNQLRIRGDV